LRPGHWFVRDIVFKYHASCYGTQAPIEGARALAPRLDIDDIETIFVEIEPQYLSVCGIAVPGSASEARFSIAHMVALALLGYDTAGESGFARERLGAPEVVQLRDRVALAAGDELGRATSRVTVSCRDGRSMTHLADASNPEQDLEAQERRLIQKSRALLAGLYRDDAIADIQQRILGLEHESDIAAWAGELTQALLAAARQQ
jgi:2-methylcitrate dehydratase PrpD